MTGSVLPEVAGSAGLWRSSSSSPLSAPPRDRVDGGVDSVTIRKITSTPGTGTGERCHYGQLIGVVTSDDLTHYAGIYPGGVRVCTAGESSVEGARRRT